MPTAYRDDDEIDDDPLDADLGEDSADLAEMACPACGATVTEDTQKCPRCGDWITPVEPVGGGGKRWVFVGAVLLMILLMLAFLR